MVMHSTAMSLFRLAPVAVTEWSCPRECSWAGGCRLISVLSARHTDGARQVHSPPPMERKSLAVHCPRAGIVASPRFREIGRASCRERAEVEGGAVGEYRD